jgi:hypothetical protein
MHETGVVPPSQSVETSELGHVSNEGVSHGAPSFTVLGDGHVGTHLGKAHWNCEPSHVHPTFSGVPHPPNCTWQLWPDTLHGMTGE